MTSLLPIAIVFALSCYAIGMGLVLLRLFLGPSAQDRVLSVDYMSILAMLVMLVLGIRYSSNMYFESALLVAMFGFVSSSALAKFLWRGEVIE